MNRPAKRPAIERGHLLIAHMDSAMYPGALHGGHQLRSRRERHRTRTMLHIVVATFVSLAVLGAWQ